MPESIRDINHRHPDYQEQEELWQLMDDCYDGDRAIKSEEKARTYLPQESLEENETYWNRLTMARFYGATRKAVNGLTGLVFRKPSDHNVTEQTPKTLRAIDNIDRMGTTATQLARHSFNTFLRRGHVIFFVDLPPTIEGMTQEQAELLDHRPFLTFFDPREVINWRIEKNSAGREVFTLLVREQKVWVENPENRLQLKQALQVTVYEPGRFTVYQQVGDEFGIIDEGDIVVNGSILNFIPAFVVYSDKEGPMKSRPPLLDFALENVRHYQVDTDRRFNNHLTSYPLAIFTGWQKQEIGDRLGIGPERGMRTNNPEAKAFYLETSGAASANLTQELKDSEQKMSVYALRLFDTDDNLNETLGAKKMRAAAANSTLAMMAIEIGEGISQALELIGTWSGEEFIEDIEFRLNKDFTALTLEPQLIQQLIGLADRELLPIETLWDLLREGELNLPANDILKESLAIQGLFSGRGLPEPEPETEQPQGEELM